MQVGYNPHGLGVLKRCISQSRVGPGQHHLLQEMARQALDLVPGHRWLFFSLQSLEKR